MPTLALTRLVFTRCEAAESFTLLLAPFAPHLAEELWEHLGHNGTLAYEPWPKYDEKQLVVDEIELLVQVLGKPKARLMVPNGADQATAEKLALADKSVIDAIAGRQVVKIIYVPGRLMNIVAK